MIQTKSRGDITGFKRISWDEAIDYVADRVAAAVKRKQELGYVPILQRDNWSPWSLERILKPHKPYICVHGNDSFGYADVAKFDAVGANAYGNSLSDRFNSDLIITWGVDATRTTSWVEHAHWLSTKAREAGIPSVVISPNHSDAASILCSGTTAAVDGKNVKIPGWIPIRPATDGALAVAMAYVIYKRNLHDKAFLRDQCFGFYKGQKVVSTAPGTNSCGKPYNTKFPPGYETGREFVDAAGRKFKTGDKYAGATFQVPPGESFQEYLEDLELGHNWSTRRREEPFEHLDSGKADKGVYRGVLGYAARLTGVPAETIEALAVKYASVNAALLEAGAGAQRAWNGYEWCWSTIALAAVAGHTNKKGGGPGGFLMASQPERLAVTPVLRPGVMIDDVETGNTIYIGKNSWAHTVLTGKDYRDEARFIEDTKICTRGAVDLSGREKLLEIDMLFLRHWNIVQTYEDVNKNITAMKALKDVIVMDQVMTASAVLADIVLPAATHFEKENIGYSYSSSCTFMMEKAIDPLYDTLDADEIVRRIGEKLSEKLGEKPAPKALAKPAEVKSGGSGDPMIDLLFSLGQPSAYYIKHIDPNARPMTYEAFKKEGFMEFPVPSEKSMVGFRDFNIPGKLENTTGRINLYSPFWGALRPAKRDKDGNLISGMRNATARYQPNREGFESFFEDGDVRKKYTGYRSPVSGRTYTMQYITNKARGRAHTVFDSNPMIREKFPHTVKMNPADAKRRGIEDGDLVYLYNDRGCMKIPAEVSHYMVPGVVSVEHGAWYRAHPSETVTIWTNDQADNVYRKKTVPVDAGGADNLLTYDEDIREIYITPGVNAQGGACEVSKTKPA
jgi:anaerobic dimethyl sulfoxide reductase subunit A